MCFYQYSTDPVHCTYVVKSNFLDSNNNSSTNKLFTSVLCRQEHKASQLINTRFSHNCYRLTIANSNKRKFSDLIDYHQDTTQLFEAILDLYDNNLGRLSEHGHIRILIKDKKFNTEQNQWSWVAGKNIACAQTKLRIGSLRNDDGDGYENVT